ncbi:MAG: hypothetical protein COV59_00670 [Candidatus Magasanikbacteria bacterium CG11_big_fil_rev_8_21_14_0_20_39_34]|uniref:DUF5667 domain-containing protein n=1 Tax=Candidatus Magasanikbacteria bacterium CG11_big_fil_rev_8_21_14_0_20_39_34 TaxID=1974653 RepID=A0A2H0N8K3_9BACT|nr:MAG: hypothetical protein COV59_00670 [Candidatus Magasanikbacteria bacterium CG11_big_fil_rev_8_21_14_0_20_39_34]
MDQFFKKIHRFRNEIEMNEKEHQQMDDAILSFMQENPLQGKKQKIKKEKVHSPSLMGAFLAGFARSFVYVALAIVVVIVGGGATTFAAEGALPGEALYGFKVNVSEELRSAFLFSERDKAQWEAERVERRLLEIEKLIQQNGHPDDQFLELAQENITRHSKQVALATRSLHDNGDSEAILSIVNQLQGSLDTYSRLLSELVQKNPGAVDPEVQKLVENIESTQQTAKSAEFRLFLARQGITGPDIGEDGDLPNDKRIQFVFPEVGESLVMGNSYAILWTDQTHESGSLTLELLREDNSVAGFIGVKSSQDGKIIWDPKFIFRHENDLQSEKLEPGTFKIRASFFGNSGTRFTSISGVFHVIEPTVTSTGVQVNVRGMENGVDTSVHNALVEIFDMKGMKVDSHYTDVAGKVYFRVIPGTYTIRASSSNASQYALTKLSVAYVKDTSVDLSLILDQKKEDPTGKTELQLAPFQKGIEFITPNRLAEFFKYSTNANIIRWKMLDGSLGGTASNFFLRNMDGRIADIITENLPGLFKGSLLYNIPHTILPGRYYIEVEAKGNVVGRSEIFDIIDSDAPLVNVDVVQEETYYVAENTDESIAAEFSIKPSAKVVLDNILLTCSANGKYISQARIQRVGGKLSKMAEQSSQEFIFFDNLAEPISEKAVYRVFVRVKEGLRPQTIFCGIAHPEDISFEDKENIFQVRSYGVRVDVTKKGRLQIVKREVGDDTSFAKILAPVPNFYKRGYPIILEWRPSSSHSGTQEQVQILLEGWGGEVLAVLSKSISIDTGKLMWQIPEDFAPNTYRFEIIGPGGVSVQSNMFSVVSEFPSEDY